MMDNDGPTSERGKGAPSGGTLTLLALIFPVAAITGGLFYLLFRKGRQRFSVVFSLVAALWVILFAAWLITGGISGIQEIVANLGEISSNWTKAIAPLVIVNFALGGLVGLFFVAWDARQMRIHPYRVQVSGNWMYKFKYNRTPLQVLRRKKAIERLRAGEFADPVRAPLGLDEENNDSVTYRYGTEAVKQTIISGAAGSGKTITLLSLISNDIKHGAPVIVIDFKRSPELASKIASWTKDAGGTFHHFVNGTPSSYDVKNSPGQAFYDPLRNGSPTAKADMVLGMREYDTASAVYKAAMQQLLQVLFAMLKYADREKAPSIAWDQGGIYQVASAVTGSNLTELASACEGTPIQAEAEAIDQESKGKTQIRHAMDELKGQIRTIVASEYGRWLKQSSEAANIDLFEMTKTSGNVILFSLNSDAEPDFARYIGAMILSDLTGVSAKRRNGKLTNQVNVYVDEFQAVPPTSVTSLLEKSRESRVAMTLAQQSFEQIIASSEKNGEAYLLSILDTCSNFIIHNGATEDSAERLSKILGKHWVTVYTQSNQNQSSFLSTNWANKRNQTIQTKEEERWIFEPRQFMSLSSPDKNNGFRSTAVIVNKTSSDPIFKDRTGGATARTVWMIPDQKVIQDYYEPSFDGVEDDGYKAPAVPASIIPQVTSKSPTEYSDRSFEEPEEFDYFASKASYEQSRVDSDEFETVGDDEEDEDGGYGWNSEDDSVEPEDEDREMREASALPSLPALDFMELPEIPVVVNESKRIPRADGRRSVNESSSFGSRTNSAWKPQTLDRTKPAVSQKKEPIALVKEPKAEKAAENFDPDSFTLPPLD